MLVLVVIEAVVLAFLALLVAGLLRSHAEILRTFHDLGIGRDPLAAPGGVTTAVPPPTLAPATAGSGTRATDISGTAPGGEVVVVGIEGAAQPTLLAFLSSGCITCRQFWDTFATPLELPGGARLVIVTMGVEAESASAIAKLAPAEVTTVMASDAWDAYDVPGSPYFVFVEGGTGRLVGQGTAPEWDQVVRLMTDATDDGVLEESRAESEHRTRRAERRKLDDRAREARADAILAAAGIHPGDASLYPAVDPEPEE